MAGHQGYQFSTGLDQDFLHLIGHDNLDLYHFIGGGVPQVCDDDFISNFQIGDIAEVAGASSLIFGILEKPR